MKKVVLMLLLAAATFVADAQIHGSIIIGRPGYGYGRGYGRFRGGYGRRYGGYRQQPPQQARQRPQLPPFQPSVNINAGYGFPNLDKEQFASFYNLYKGNIANQMGPFTGAIDYQFSRYVSIGVMGTYGKVSQPYFTFNNTTTSPDMTGHYENWSLLLNIVSYFPTRTKAVSPYLRTAIGYQNWTQNYTNADGSKEVGIDLPSSLAYQVSLGAKFNLSPRAGIFLEAGYGKYIASGGLAVKF